MLWLTALLAVGCKLDRRRAIDLVAPDSMFPEEAESTADFRQRVNAGLQQILEASPCKEVAVVAHGGVIRMLLALLLEMPFARMSAFDIEYASITKVKITPIKTEVELLNFAPWRDL